MCHFDIKMTPEKNLGAKNPLMLMALLIFWIIVDYCFFTVFIKQVNST